MDSCSEEDAVRRTEILKEVAAQPGLSYFERQPLSKRLFSLYIFPCNTFFIMVRALLSLIRSYRADRCNTQEVTNQIREPVITAITGPPP